ncbi:MAG TPA: porphobilinogen synthase [Anaerolineaceae bacterium]|nr:porphobilinogen synthase [Anaerolineaceae bacterium]
MYQNETSPPNSRPRRLRLSHELRNMVRETTLAPENFIYPLFITHGNAIKHEISSMPGVYQWSPDLLADEVKEIFKLGIPSVILFGIPQSKDPIGLENFSPDGIIQQGIRAIKQAVPEIIVITDVCLCEYTDHGHCGLLNLGEERNPHLPEGYVLNDETVNVLAKVAVSHAQSGADMIAPSGMMDGMVSAIRELLDQHNFEHIPIMSYSVKYASSFYGPFREAAQGAPKFGDRKSHQMDPANVREGLREAKLDIQEGADILMVKPALAYLDVISKLRETYPEYPLAAYNVSGEYSMIKAAAEKGWLDERKTILEVLLSIKRAGADLIISYHAKEAARWLKEEQ